ncbi:HIT family protein [Pontibacter virosus]|uniref:Histidine triad (HIT) family protein n=1 Tax=Pontibacter virosus TaxID=1765052 RepID=A0A2U1AUQ6_9BACT|nr:HIT family protein [Pontibacter virosus]PVY40130.1 histidine triad (HIT) family protein [Pontibacter virosus]
MEPSIFTKIVKGEIPAYKIAEDDRYLAFLDVFPTTKGHTLVIPKQQIDYLFDLDEQLYMGLMAFAKKVAAAVEKAVPCKRIGVAVVGLEVPHAHVHLIPLNKMADMNFANKQQFNKEEFEEVAEKIREVYKTL